MDAETTPPKLPLTESMESREKKLAISYGEKLAQLTDEMSSQRVIEVKPNFVEEMLQSYKIASELLDKLDTHKQTELAKKFNEFYEVLWRFEYYAGIDIENLRISQASSDEMRRKISFIESIVDVLPNSIKSHIQYMKGTLTLVDKKDNEVEAKKERNELALNYFNETIRLNWGFVAAYVRKGKVLKELGRDEEAEEVLKEACEIRVNMKIRAAKQREDIRSRRYT